MKKTSIYLAVICLSVACMMGCTPTAKPTASQTAQQTAQPTAVDKAELAVKITSDITWDTPDDPESGDVKAIIHGLNDKDQEIWSHTFAIKVLTELSPVSPATLADGRAYIEIERTLYALSLADGSIVWQLDDVGASAGGPLVDDDGTIYLSGYYGPHLLAVSKDGRELWRANDVDDDYYRSYKLTKEGDYLKVYYESREGQTPDYLLFDKQGNQVK
ncbi:MAG: PQQ-binding-like beta-propeller repeat protein [Christensenellales bacterium]